MHFSGGNGRHGSSKGKIGKDGKDVFVRVPVGTIVTEKLDDSVLEVPASSMIPKNSNRKKIFSFYIFLKCIIEFRGGRMGCRCIWL